METINKVTRYVVGRGWVDIKNPNAKTHRELKIDKLKRRFKKE